MALKNKPLQDLIQIVSFGGGLDFDASTRSTQDLIQIVSHAKEGARLVLRGVSGRSTQDLIQIASHGKGTVVFAD